MSQELIQEGDDVTVYPVGDQQGWFHGKVRYMPQAAGECWIIETQYELFYVQTFGSIRKPKSESASAREARTK